MLFVLVSAFITILIMPVIWYIMHIPLIHIIDSLVAQYPAAYESLVTEVIVNLVFWFLGIVLFGILNYVYVNSQRPRPYEVRI